MEVKFFKESKLLLIKITEEIDECNVKELRRKLDYEIERFCSKRVVFDFNRVTFMDSSGIGLIIGRYKQIALLGGRTEITNLNQSVKKIFEMSRSFKINS